MARRFATRFARIDSRESFAVETPIFIARQADSHESLEFPIRANHAIRANRANRFARITPLRAALIVLHGTRRQNSLWSLIGRGQQLWSRSSRAHINNFDVPLHHIESCLGQTYFLQLNLYKHILESRHGLSISEMLVVGLHPLVDEDACQKRREP